MMVIESKANLWGKDGLLGQKIPAMGNALDNCNRLVVDTPCKSKRVIIFITLLPFQGEFSTLNYRSRVLPWADCSLALQAVLI